MRLIVIKPLRYLSCSKSNDGIVSFSHMTYYNESFGWATVRWRRWKNKFMSDILGIWIKSFDMSSPYYHSNQHPYLQMTEVSKKAYSRYYALESKSRRIR